MNDERNCFGLNLLHAEELEDAVVGAAMLETNSLNEIIGFVRPEMFYKKDNRYIWEAIEALVKAGLQPDLLMVAHKLAEMGRLEEAGGPYGVTRKTSNLASSAHLWEHVHVVYEFYLRRSVVESLAKRLGAAADRTQDIYEVLDGMMHDLMALREGSPLEDHLTNMKG